MKLNPGEMGRKIEDIVYEAAKGRKEDKETILTKCSVFYKKFHKE